MQLSGIGNASTCAALRFPTELGARVYMRLSIIISFLIVINCPKLISASQFYCQKGDPVTADLGDGVIMRTCIWKQDPNVAIRVGPLELIKNGILILRTQTNSKGKLHGPFRSWSDEGEIQEKGDYVNGLKEGLWVIVKKDGNRESINYKGGIPVEP